MERRRFDEVHGLTLGALLLAAVLALSACGGCAGKNGAAPPNPSTVSQLVAGAAQLGCGLFVPAEQRDAARPVLRAIALMDPAAAYAEISKPDVATVAPVIGLLWTALHSVIDQQAPDSAAWVRYAEQSAQAAAVGCLVGIRPAPPMAGEPA